jgi:hypothetical protein
MSIRRCSASFSNYGNITIRGTGSTFEPLQMVDAPLKLRATVTAGVTAAPFRGSHPSRFCPASAKRRRIVAPVESAPLFERRAARRMPDCENLDRLGIYTVK